MKNTSINTKAVIAKATRSVIDRQRKASTGCSSSNFTTGKSSGSVVLSARPYGINIADRIVTNDEINAIYKKAIEDAKRI